MNKQAFQYAVIVVSFMSILYGITYQQYGFFNLNDPRGSQDAVSYIQMSHNNYDVSSVHRYRFVIPVLAKYVRTSLTHFINSDDQDVLSFYIVNYIFTLISSLIFLALLKSLGFDSWLSIAGVVIFMCSRITILTTGTPLIDSFFYMSVLLILFLTVTDRGTLLALSMPFLCLSKETILPFLFFPLLTHLRRSPGYLASLVVSIGVFISSRYVIDGRFTHSNSSFLSVINEHIEACAHNAAELFSLKGMHDLQNGFSLFLVLGLLGFYINYKHRLFTIPVFFHLIVPMSLFFALLSGNSGRMFFISFPVIIPYVLILFLHLRREFYSQDE
jgi:hypothetical protein